LRLVTISTSHTSSATVKDFADMSACRFIYNSLDGSFTEIPQERLQRGQGQHPYDHCHVCLMVEEQEEALVPHKIRRGVAWKGAKYHLRDFVMIKAQEGPCHIGQITHVHIQQSDDEGWVRVRMFGRISKLGLRPAEELKDEVRAQNPRTYFTLTHVLSVISLSRKIKWTSRFPVLSECVMFMCERLCQSLKNGSKCRPITFMLATPSRASM
jgi:hypothetical protein